MITGRAGASTTRLPARTALLLISFAEVSTGHPRPRRLIKLKVVNEKLKIFDVFLRAGT